MNNSRYYTAERGERRAFDNDLHNHENAISQGRLSDEMDPSNRNLDFEYDAVQEKRNSYSSQLKIRHSASMQSGKIRDISTNYSNAQYFSESHDLASSALNTTRASLNDQTIEIGSQQASKTKAKNANKRDLLSIFNKASDFWSGKLGIGGQQEPGRHPQQQRSKPSKPANMMQYQQTKQMQQQLSQPINLKLTRANTDNYPGINNQNAGIIGREMSDADFGKKLEVNDFALENQQSVSNDDGSTVSQQQRANLPQSNGSRSNTLYKFLNNYFQGPSESKTVTKPPSTQQRSQSQHDPEPQKNQIQQPYEYPQESLSDHKHIRDILANNNPSMGLKAKLSSLRQSCNKHSSSLLKKKLEIHQHALPSVVQSNSQEKLKRKYVRKIWTSEKEQLLKDLVAYYDDDWERISAEMQDPQITSEVAFHYYTTKLNPISQRMRFSAEEDRLIGQYYNLHGPNWKLIMEHLPGRTEVMIRNRYYSRVRKLKSGLLNAEDVPNPQASGTGSQFKSESCPKDSELQALLLEPQQGSKPDEMLEERPLKDIMYSPFGFKFDYKNSIAAFDPMSLNNHFSDLSLRPDGIEEHEKIFQDKLDGLFCEADPFIRLNEGSVKNHSDMGIGCLSPIINPLLPSEWEEHPLLLLDHRVGAEDQISLFKEKFDQNKAQKSNKSGVDGDYCNYLIDFKQESPINRKLSPDSKSSSSKGGRNLPPLQTHVQPRTDEDAVASTNDPSTNNNQNNANASKNNTSNENKGLFGVELPIGDDLQSKKIIELVSQIRSIEMLFNLTRKEINKLQNEF